jgi:hypothetical protein
MLPSSSTTQLSSVTGTPTSSNRISQENYSNQLDISTRTNFSRSSIMPSSFNKQMNRKVKDRILITRVKVIGISTAEKFAMLI